MTGLAFLIGVDVGTTHVKAALVAADGTVLHVARRPTPVHVLPGGLTDHPQAELVAAAEAVVAECVQAAPTPTEVAAIGIASFAEAGTLLDRRNQPIGELIAWFDPRSEREAAEVETAFGAPELFRVTGLRPLPKYSLPKLLWIARHRPAVFKRARSWVGGAELVALAMTGATGTNASLASRTMAYDVGARRWDTDLLACAGLTVDQMPRVLPLGHPVGGLTPGSAGRLGLPSGVPVVVAGQDHHVGGIGAGVRPGMALDSIGSAEACLLITSRPALDDSLRVAGFSVGCHAVDDQWYVIAALQASGTLVEWFIEHLMPATVAASDARYAAFLELLAGARPGPGHVVALPYLRGRTTPEPAEAARLTFLGIGETEGLADLAAALIDGAACAVRWIFDEIEARASVRVSRVRVIGGGARIDRWRMAKAALSRAPIDLVDAEEATALGAALAAGIGGGVFGSISDAMAHAARATAIDRSAAFAKRYDEFYRHRFLPAARAEFDPRPRTGQGTATD